MQRCSLSLSNGVQLPLCGLGTFRLQGDQAQHAVAAALAAGIRNIDTASIYKNEAAIAAALAASGLPRSDVFITTKLSPYEQGRAKAATALAGILERLQTSYVDLLLIHWPGVSRTLADSPLNAQLRFQTWQVLEAAYASGQARAVGVSNFHEHQLRQLLEQGLAVRPMVNQIEVHPRRPEAALRRACDDAGIAVVAYASLGCGHLLQQPVVQQLAAKHGRSEAQVLLRWGIQNGCAVIPKSSQPERIAEFAPAQLLDGWQLSEADMAALAGLEDGHKYCWDASSIT